MLSAKSPVTWCAWGRGWEQRHYQHQWLLVNIFFFYFLKKGNPMQSLSNSVHNYQIGRSLPFHYQQHPLGIYIIIINIFIFVFRYSCLCSSRVDSLLKIPRWTSYRMVIRNPSIWHGVRWHPLRKRRGYLQRRSAVPHSFNPRVPRHHPKMPQGATKWPTHP